MDGNMVPRERRDFRSAGYDRSGHGSTGDGGRGESLRGSPRRLPRTELMIGERPCARSKTRIRYDSSVRRADLIADSAVALLEILRAPREPTARVISPASAGHSSISKCPVSVPASHHMGRSGIGLPVMKWMVAISGVLRGWCSIATAEFVLAIGIFRVYVKWNMQA